jgi:hypothetical protein
MANEFLPPINNQPSVSLTLAQKVAYLADLGHFKGMTTPEALAAIKQADSKELSDAVASWQAFHSQPVTGFMSNSDVSLIIGEKRCGLPDIEMAGTSMRKWGVKKIRLSHNMTALNGVTKDQIIAAYIAAAKSWSDVCGLDMEVVPWTGKGQTHIWAQGIRIDGGGGTLAWSYLPGTPSGDSGRLEQRYDPGEAWTESYLQGVAAHEIGHALGLEHTNRQADLMYPYARRNLILPQSNDIARVVERYGKRTTTTPPTDPGSGGGGQGPAPKVSVSSVVVNLSDGTSQTLNGSPSSGTGYSFSP